MATVERRTYPTASGRDSVRYVVRYRTPENLQRSKSFKLKRDADAYAATIETSKLVGDFIDANRARTTVGVWAHRWIDNRAHLAPKTRERYEGIVTTHIVPRWGRVALGDVEHDRIQAWLTGLDELSPASVRKVHRVFSMVLDAAVKDRRIARNVAKGVSLPRVGKPEHRYLTHQQVEQLADAVGPSWSLVARFLAYTGVRWGELAALRVGRIDLKRNRALIAESVTPVAGVMTFGPTKGHERREVPIPAFLIVELVEHLRGRPADALAFAGPRGAVLRSQTFQRASLTDAAIALGLASDSGQRDDEGRVKWVEVFHPHEFRHTAASLAIAAGADVKVVQQMLGHKSATMTLDLYGHLFGDRLDLVAHALDAARAEALGIV